MEYVLPKNIMLNANSIYSTTGFTSKWDIFNFLIQLYSDFFEELATKIYFNLLSILCLSASLCFIYTKEVVLTNEKL